jgi:hypothetical protein
MHSPIGCQRVPSIVLDYNAQSHHILLLEHCHIRFLRPKPDAHRMYAQDQVVIHTVRM